MKMKPQYFEYALTTTLDPNSGKGVEFTVVRKRTQKLSYRLFFYDGDSTSSKYFLFSVEDPVLEPTRGELGLVSIAQSMMSGYLAGVGQKSSSPEIEDDADDNIAWRPATEELAFYQSQGNLYEGIPKASRRLTEGDLYAEMNPVHDN